MGKKIVKPTPKPAVKLIAKIESKPMDASATVALANLLAELIPLGIGAYQQIKDANQDANLKPLEEILTKANLNADAIIATAQAEIAKFSPAASAPAPAAPEPVAAPAPAVAPALVHDFGVEQVIAVL